MKRLLPAVLLTVATSSFAAGTFDFENSRWPASWIKAPGSDPQEYGVYHFRKTFNLNSQPDKFVVFLSGDNRYQLFVNGQLVSWGPARSDLYHWRYEAVDIASRLHSGTNVFAAVVQNDGPFRAVAQNTNQTGFLLQAEAPEHWFVDSDKSWKCIEDRAYSPLRLPPNQMIGYQAIGANERLDGAQYPWGWESPGFDDAAWQNAGEISRGAGRDSQDAPNRWMLAPRYIPLEELTPLRIESVRKSDGITPPADFPRNPHAFAVSPHKHVMLLLDQSYLTTAYPELTISGGKGSTITLRYAESLYEPQPAGSHQEPLKGNRNEVEGKVLYGRADTFLADGGEHRVYRPLFWRTYRYVELDIDTADSPLSVEDIRGLFTAYPFARNARITVSDPTVNEEIQQILTTGWRTARLCAHETYMDCPYYEQLQYAGDARIQMLVSLFTSGDSRLMKQGIEALNSSRTAEGATYSRAPSYLQQYIPPFSLWWIGMVHDYWMYVDDPAFVKDMLPGVQAVLSFFGSHQKPSGSLARMPWWNFVDWTRSWKDGVPPAEADDSSSAALDLQLLLAYRWGADLENAFGSRASAQDYTEAAAKLKATILQTDWDAARGLFADQPSHRSYSQQVNTLAVLADLKPAEDLQTIVEKMLSDPGLEKSSIYFRAYTNATLRKVNLGDRYLENLGAWREMLRQGLTTWAETDRPDSRSDCHAWGASPNFEIFRTLVGIESIAPGFRNVRIAPNIGNLQSVSAAIPHPHGEITVDLANRGGLTADVTLPEGVTGEFVWAGAKRNLHAGRNHLTFASGAR
ncbi:MAG: family 78 glycoside hydrolase catalytic domain [Acidobacteriaceae bacterium]|nr:family 78 glycoside hydrolase catalytic domain [Acidobacteriaceae bacterium]